MFTTFGNKFPEYEVITPQTKQSFCIRSLTVQEEERLKGSLITPIKITEHLNKCIFETLAAKPENIKTFDDFLKKVTVKDRDALLYGLYHVTYEDIRNYEVTCDACKTVHQVTVKASDTFNFNPYQGENIFSENSRVKLPLFKNVTVVIKQPTLFDELLSMRELINRPGSTLDLVIETMIISKFEQDIESSKELVVYDDKVDILDAYLTLPPLDRRKIYKEYFDKFGQYGVDLKMSVRCPKCDKDQTISVDLVETFFRSLYSA